MMLYSSTCTGMTSSLTAAQTWVTSAMATRVEGRENDPETKGIVDGAHGTVVAAVVACSTGGFRWW